MCLISNFTIRSKYFIITLFKFREIIFWQPDTECITQSPFFQRGLIQENIHWEGENHGEEESSSEKSSTKSGNSIPGGRTPGKPTPARPTDEESENPCGADARHLINCEQLVAKPNCDEIRYVQFLQPMRIDKQGKGKEYIHPTKLAKAILHVAYNEKQIAAQMNGILASGQARFKSLAPKQALRIVKKHLHKKTIAKEPFSIDPESDFTRQVLEDYSRMEENQQAAPQAKYTTGLKGIKGFVESINETIQEMADLLAPPEAIPALNPTVGIGIAYKQTWCSQGYTRGRLVRSIPLTAGETKEIVVKSWKVNKQRREENESVDQERSTEFVGDEKWSRATSKEVSATMNQEANANLNANGNVTIPVKGVPVGIGAGGGGGGTVGNSLSTTLTETIEEVKQNTVTATSKLKNSVSSTVETSEEAGIETTVTDKISNANKCNSLTYHYFEIDEVFKVDTVMERMDPYILIPFSYPELSIAWILCHECQLKPLLPCELYYKGFEAARILRANEMLGEGLGDLNDKEVVDFFNKVLDVAIKVARIYDTLKNADAQGTFENAGGFTGAVGQELNEFANDPGGYIQENLDEFSDWAMETGTQVGNTLREGFENTVEVVGGFLGFSMQMAPNTPPGTHASIQALTISGPSGGLGSMIYWKVMEEVAPEMAHALAELKANLESLPDEEGATRNRLLLSALDLFFTNVGNYKETFRKLNVGLAYLAYTVSGISIAGPSVMAGMVLILAGASPYLVAAALLGVGAVMALIVLGVALAAIIAESQGGDVIPDDEGLEAAIGALHGIYQQAKALVMEPPGRVRMRLLKRSQNTTGG